MSEEGRDVMMLVWEKAGMRYGHTHTWEGLLAQQEITTSGHTPGEQ